MSKHTPGPWIIDLGHSIKGSNGMQVAYADLMSKEDEALILSAPDLLHALEYMLAYQYDMDPKAQADCDMCAKARAAIAKARGEI